MKTVLFRSASGNSAGCARQAIALHTPYRHTNTLNGWPRWRPRVIRTAGATRNQAPG